MPNWLEPTILIKTVGLIGVLLVIFAESGLLIGFFLPGDSLLFTAGWLASQGYLPFGWLLVGAIVAAILGDSAGYWFGAKVGESFIRKPGSWWQKRGYVAKTEAFYARHGQRTIILARFIPVVRTFAPIMAGVGAMPYKEFFRYNWIGGLVWAGGVTAAGYYFGRLVPGADHYLSLVIGAIIIISILPAIVEFARSRYN